MNTFSHVPPGFRFHPTDEELVDYYLRKKVASKRIDLDVIRDVDLYKIEPWDLQELCKIGSEEQSEWYFFSHKDKKYPTGTRTNRATKAGFWKATGRDKAIYSRHSLIGMRKTLVFYKGRAPNGQKSDWIMHEYRLETNENGTPQEEGWVVCRVFKKRMPTMRKVGDYESPCWYDEQLLFLPEVDSPRRIPQPFNLHHHYPCKQELELQYNINPFLQLPQLESPKVPYTLQEDQQQPQPNNQHLIMTSSIYANNTDQVTDWRVLDKFVASQLSHEDASKDQPTDYSNGSSVFEVAEQINALANASKGPLEIGHEFLASTSTTSSSCQIDLC